MKGNLIELYWECCWLSQQDSCFVCIREKQTICLIFSLCLKISMTRCEKACLYLTESSSSNRLQMSFFQLKISNKAILRDQWFFLCFSKLIIIVIMMSFGFSYVFTIYAFTEFWQVLWVDCLCAITLIKYLEYLHFVINF